MERKNAEKNKTATPVRRNFRTPSSDQSTAGLSLFELHARNMRQREQKAKEAEQQTKERMAYSAPSGQSRNTMAREQAIVDELPLQSESLCSFSQLLDVALHKNSLLRSVDNTNLQLQAPFCCRKDSVDWYSARNIVLKSNQAKRTFKSQIQAVHKIQVFLRRAHAIKQAREEARLIQEQRAREVFAATKIQSTFRGHSAKSKFSSQVNTVIRLQSYWRRSLAYKQLSVLKAEAEIQLWMRQDLEESMALKIQSQWRGKQACTEVRKLKADALAEKQAREAQVAESMAKVIQAHWRGAAARSKVSTLRNEATQAELENLKALQIQCAWRGAVARAAIAAFKTEAMVKEQEMQARLESAMALKIQCKWRGLSAQAQLQKMKIASVENRSRQIALENSMALKIQ
uniref:Uncharacterized protein n=1 Tax=Globisporangium ultimum (strain ATCC 200006 / CBS 805.95 / DAOM BR144) TaxID=431595 RepID=K3WMI0_GLOUD